jgi:S1-C subfamily serine protease
MIIVYLLLFFMQYSFAFDSEINKSLIRVNTTSNAFNYKSPWLAPQQYEKSGTGFILEGNKILTNAHIISDSVYIEVRRADDITPYQAEVALVDHDCDLAILKIQDKKFMEGALPLFLTNEVDVGDSVNVYGFPIGGDEVSLTQGVISRIEIHEYAHSGKHLLLAQIDAAINPGNSGGPVLTKKGKVVGVATQGYTFGQNIGYMIPIQVLKHFIDDANSKSYKGFPALDVRVQIMESPALREKYDMDFKHSGILINKLSYSLKQSSMLKENDIIISINDIDISNNGTILLKNNLRVRADYLISKSFIGDNLKLKVIRGGKQHNLKVKLDRKTDENSLVKGIQYESKPTYYIFSGLVLQPLSANYLYSFGADKWPLHAPALLTYYYRQGEISEKRKEIVVLNRVLPDIANLGYQYIRDAVIESINGTEVSDLKHAIKIIESNKNKYLEIILFDKSKIVLDHNLAVQRNNSILMRYNILKDRSDDMI